MKAVAADRVTRSPLRPLSTNSLVHPPGGHRQGDFGGERSARSRPFETSSDEGFGRAALAWTDWKIGPQDAILPHIELNERGGGDADSRLLGVFPVLLFGWDEKGVGFDQMERFGNHGGTALRVGLRPGNRESHEAAGGVGVLLRAEHVGSLNGEGVGL